MVLNGAVYAVPFNKKRACEMALTNHLFESNIRWQMCAAALATTIWLLTHIGNKKPNILYKFLKLLKLFE